VSKTQLGGGWGRHTQPRPIYSVRTERPRGRFVPLSFWASYVHKVETAEVTEAILASV
jgi:hypothetical protein